MVATTPKLPAPKLFALACVTGSHKADQKAAAAGISRYTGVSLPVVERLFLSSGVSTRGGAVVNDSDRMVFEYDHILTTSERMQLFYERASHLAFQAVGNTFRRSQIAPDAITHLVTASCTGFVAPGVDHAIIQKFGLRDNVERTHVGFMGCHAAVNMLRVAKALAQTPGNVVLVCCFEVSSIHLQPSTRSEDLVGAALFSDGAASAIVSCEAPAGSLPFGSSLSLYMPEGADLMTWKIGDTGFVMRLGSQLPAFLASRLEKSSIALWLKQSASIALHPGGGRLLRAAAEALHLSPDDHADSKKVLELFGNMSSPTPLFVLERLLMRKAKLPIAVLAFGPGLHAEGILLGE